MKNDLTTIFIDEIYSKVPKKHYPTNKIIYNHIEGIWSINLADFSVTKFQIIKVTGFSLQLALSQNICGLYHLKVKFLRQCHKNFHLF